MVKFVGGQILKNQAKWRQAVAFLEDNGGHVPEFFKEAVETGKFNVRHPAYTNKNASHVCFRGFVYKSKHQLLKADLKNRKSVAQNLADVKNECEVLEKCQVIRRITKEEAEEPGSVVSPILWVTQVKSDGSKKNRLIHHCRLNYMYSKPRFALTQIADELDQLAEFEEIAKYDMEKFFYQFSIDEVSSKTLRFRVGEDYFEWKALCMGISCAPYIAQTASGVLTEVFSRTYNVYIGSFIVVCVDFSDIEFFVCTEIIKISVNA